MEDSIKSLIEALEFSPNNIALRFHLAQVLIDANRLDEAEEQYLSILELEKHPKAKLGLAHIYYEKEDFSTCNVILEELIDNDHTDFDIKLLYTKGLVKENSIQKAIEIYQELLEINPSFHDEDLDQYLKVSQNPSEFPEDDNHDHFIQRPSINFKHVGGMDNVKKEIDLKIIKPLSHPELYEAYGKKIGGGILLYGPPGCGKTYLAKATAGQVKAKFINVSLNDILDMWIGASEKKLHEIFEVARQNTPCVLFFDEIDALGASRSDMKQSAGRHLINQFLQELDGIDNNNDGVLVLGATNTPWHLDSAFRRPGRFDRIIFVPPPDENARESIFKLKLAKKPTTNLKYDSLAKKTKNYSGADIEALIDIAIEEKLEEAILKGAPQPITNKEILNAVKRHKPSTQEWFSSAKNFALYANESGLYDDVLDFLKIKK